MGKLAPREVDRRGMAVLREMQALRRQSLRGLAAATFDDLRLGAVLDALQPDDGAVLDAWEEFVWRIVSARRLRERAERRRADERARTDDRARGDERARGEEWDRGRPLHRERVGRGEAYPAVPPRTHREDRWVPFSDWLRDPASAPGAAGGADDPPDPWMSLHLDPIGSFWRDPWRDGRAGHTPPAEGGVAIQREPTPAPGPAVAAAAAAASAGPSRWSPPLPFERRSPPHGPQFVFDDPLDRYSFVEDMGGVQVIDLSRRAVAREAAGGSGGGAAPRFHRERHGVLLPGARSPSPGPRPVRRDTRPASASATAGDASRWLDEWSATQPLLGRRHRDASPSHTLRRVRARLDSARDAYGRDTRRDGIVFPDNIDFSGAGQGLEGGGGDLPTPRTALRDASPLVSETPPVVGGEDMRRAVAPAWTPLDADADSHPPAPARTAEPPTTLEPAQADAGVVSPTATPPPTRAPIGGGANVDDVASQPSQHTQGTLPSINPSTAPATTTPSTTATSTPAATAAPAAPADTPRDHDRPVAPLPRRPVSMLRAD